MTQTQGIALKGVIFDLDGTLVDSRLDFDLMRAEIGIPDKQPVLEFVEGLPAGEQKTRCWEILLQHEFKGAREATLIPGIAELLAKLSQLNLHQGILTRNRIEPTRLALERLGLNNFSQVLTRDDAPPKPDPTGLLMICQAWACQPHEVIFIGDYRFDIQAGQRAGMKTVLYFSDAPRTYPEKADHATGDFRRFAAEFECIMTSELGFTF